ncbi:MAG: hypothetical protein R2862_10825 [Thermoanaerobaculia bacterium]
MPRSTIKVAAGRLADGLSPSVASVTAVITASVVTTSILSPARRVRSFWMNSGRSTSTGEEGPSLAATTEWWSAHRPRRR